METRFKNDPPREEELSQRLLRESSVTRRSIISPYCTACTAARHPLRREIADSVNDRGTTASPQQKPRAIYERLATESNQFPAFQPRPLLTVEPLSSLPSFREERLIPMKKPRRREAEGKAPIQMRRRAMPSVNSALESAPCFPINFTPLRRFIRDFSSCECWAGDAISLSFIHKLFRLILYLSLCSLVALEAEGAGPSVGRRA